MSTPRPRSIHKYNSCIKLTDKVYIVEMKKDVVDTRVYYNVSIVITPFLNKRRQTWPPPTPPSPLPTLAWPGLQLASPCPEQGYRRTVESCISLRSRKLYREDSEWYRWPPVTERRVYTITSLITQVIRPSLVSASRSIDSNQTTTRLAPTPARHQPHLPGRRIGLTPTTPTPSTRRKTGRRPASLQPQQPASTEVEIHPAIHLPPTQPVRSKLIYY
jgi:hypothetical protein